jgi:hypothetical protein
MIDWGLARAVAIFFGLAAAQCFAQTTDGLISGRVSDQMSDAPVSRATIQFSNPEVNIRGVSAPDVSGNFSLPLLSPGVYSIRIEAAGYQAQEIHSLEVEVSGRIEIQFRLRPLSDVWEAGQYRSLVMPDSTAVVTFFGPDIDETRSATIDTHPANRGTLESSISSVISPEELNALPLEARDAYATIVLQPGVASGTSTGRGLGIAVNGQRPTSSNYFLDGVENNNALITGPLNLTTPESVQEYRISTSNYTAEFGRTSGFVANAVTRSGGTDWHGLLYFYLQNEAFNANDLERNRQGLPRALDRQFQPGFSTGGPILKNRLYFGLSFEYLHQRSMAAPAQFRLPTSQFYSILHFNPPATGRALQLMNQYPAPDAPIDRNTGTEIATIARPTEINRLLILPRLDYSLGKHRIAVRESYAKIALPDFIWTPYMQFITPLDQKTSGLAATATTLIRPSLTNEARFAVNFDRTNFQRRTNNLPSLVTFDPATSRIWLPGSPSFYGFDGNYHYQEIVDNVVHVHGRHISKFGGGLLLRQLEQTIDPGTFIVFRSYLSFYLDQTQYLFAPSSRLNPPALQTAFERHYDNKQFFFFAQDSVRVSKRLTIDYGLRYEHFGAPVNNGSNPDVELQLGAGSSLPASLASATLVTLGRGHALYDSDSRDFAPRAGFAYNVRESGRTVLRGSYGLFYDRPFDNLWLAMQANSFVLGAFNAVSTNYLAAPGSYLPPVLASPNQRLNVPNVTLYEPHLRNGYSQNFFLGVQQQLGGSVTLEVNGVGALGRRLITTDIINRATSAGAFSNGTINPNLPPVDYRSNQGSSDYLGVSAKMRYRSSRLNAQLAYTLSHSIDNQTDPLAGDFYDFVFTGGRNDAGQPLAGTLIDNLLQGGVPSPVAAFTRQFDSRGDRANSDFDQRHNLVGYATYRVPNISRPSATGGRALPLWRVLESSVVRDWQVSAMGAIRSGFPYSVFAPTVSGGLIYNNHANLTGDPYQRSDVTGGVELLNPTAFSIPAAGQSGNTARNEFRGPGLASADFSINRSLAIAWLGEAARVVIRADVFNVFNHANLNNPAASFTQANVSQRTFGVATYGREDAVTGFPSSTPLDESPRVVQLMVRVVF